MIPGRSTSTILFNCGPYTVRAIGWRKEGGEKVGGRRGGRREERRKEGGEEEGGRRGGKEGKERR